MKIRCSLVRGSASPKTEEFSSIEGEGSAYAPIMEDIHTRVPEGWKISSILILEDR